MAIPEPHIEDVQEPPRAEASPDSVVWRLRREPWRDRLELSEPGPVEGALQRFGCLAPGLAIALVLFMPFGMSEYGLMTNVALALMVLAVPIIALIVQMVALQIGDGWGAERLVTAGPHRLVVERDGPRGRTTELELPWTDIVDVDDHRGSLRIRDVRGVVYETERLGPPAEVRWLSRHARERAMCAPQGSGTGAGSPEDVTRAREALRSRQTE